MTDHFDFAFVGAGLSGLLRAVKLLDQLRDCQRIVLVDPCGESLKDKTFALWTHKSDPPHELSSIVEHRWNALRITGSDGATVKKSLGDYGYESISGEKLYTYLTQKLNHDARVTRLDEVVRTIRDAESNRHGQTHALIELGSGFSISASHTFVSPLKRSRAMLQSFTGLEILTKTDCFDPETIDLMDFRVPQDDEVRFVYVLPFSARNALIEVTIFSSKLISSENREFILLEYIADKLKISDYSIVRKEIGVIPMDPNAEPLFAPSFNCSALEVIGGAAGMIKPSTGYSFKRNLGNSRKRRDSSYFDLRFRFYDAIMLELMRTHGGKFSSIFFRLFNRNSSSSIFEFLDEDSSLLNEFKIFASLPKIPFITTMLCLYPYVFAVILTLVMNLTLGGYSVWFIPILGLITVGIGHGSIDHRLGTDGDFGSFIYVKYLSKMFLFFLIWYFFPAISLAFFVLQSAHHFGEAYFVRILRISSCDKRIGSLVWIWGIFAATFGILYHWSDSLPIIQKMIGNWPDLEILPTLVMRGLSFLLFAIGVIVSWILDKYQLKATGRLGQSLPATILLGISSLALPLLPGFFCFFAYWHGADSLREQRSLTGWSMITYAKKALPLTLVTHTGLAIFILLFANEANINVLWKIIFVAIGSLTAAHAPVMTSFLFRERSLSSKSWTVPMKAPI